MSESTKPVKSENIFMSASFDGVCRLWDVRTNDQPIRELLVPEKCPPWATSACWNAMGDKLYVGRRNGCVDEYDFASGNLTQTLRLTKNSGPVSCVYCLPSGKHLICCSMDNIRMWDLRDDVKSFVPFQVIPGHNSGVISHVAVDPTSKFMVTASGNRGWQGQETNTLLFYDISITN